MNVLIITGDKSFGPGQQRYELQKSAVEMLGVMYWGHGGMFPRIPAGSWDVVTVQDPFWRGLCAWHVARRLKARFNVQVHTDLVAQPLMRHILAQVVLRHADSVRVVSEKIKAQVSHIGVHTKITTLPVFIEVERFMQVVRHPEDNTILWVGRFEDEKDPLYALEVAKQIPGSRLIMLGKGSLEQQLRKQARELPVKFEGWQDPVPYLARAAVVLCTSRHESWGASIIEALAAGVPVVAPDVGIAREAGARVVPRNQLVQEVASVLQSGAPASLRIHMLNKNEWARAWRDSLI